jgi:glycine/D-amino acid oxidase-like deaminating enzyme
MRRADVVVVGAGIFGASAAYQLCRTGAGDVLLIDRDGLCAGDSGRTFGMVRRHYSNDVTALLAMRGAATLMSWADEIGVGDSGYVRTGYLLTVPEALTDACRGNVERLQELGLDTAYVGPEEIREIEPAVSVEGIAGAAYEPDGGFADAHKMVLGWFAAATQMGLRTEIGTRVTEILTVSGRIAGVRTPDGDIATERVVLATGAWGPELLRPLGVEIPMLLKRVQVAVLRQRAGGVLPNVVCSDAVTNVVVRPDRGPLFCAVTYFADELLDRADDCDHNVSPGYPEAIARALSERYPTLAGYEWHAGWAGPYDAPPDWNPILGFAPGIEGLYLALGWSGHGFKMAPAVGEVVAAEVMGVGSPIDVSRLRLERFEQGETLRLAYGPGARA